MSYQGQYGQGQHYDPSQQYGQYGQQQYQNQPPQQNWNQQQGMAIKHVNIMNPLTLNRWSTIRAIPTRTSTKSISRSRGGCAAGSWNLSRRKLFHHTSRHQCSSHRRSPTRSYNQGQTWSHDSYGGYCGHQRQSQVQYAKDVYWW